MLHLFHKTYVCPIFMLDNSKKRVIVTKDYIDTDTKLNPIKHTVSDFDSLIGADGIYKNWHTFLISLDNEEKFRIYVDIDAFNKFFVYWIKTLFPNISTNLAYKCYNCSIQRLKIHFTQAMLNNSYVDYRKFDVLNLKLLTKTEFYNFFPKQIPWENNEDRKQWVKNHLEKISIEWHLANYFTDRSHLKYFKEKYLYVLTKALSIEVHEWYEYIVKYFMKPNVKKELGIDINWDDEDWRYKFKTHPSMGWMFDDDLKYITKNMIYFKAHIREALDVGKLLKSFWFKDIKVDDKVRILDKDYFESDHANFTFNTLETLIINQDNLSDDYINNIIDKDIGRESVSIIFDLLNHVLKWNPILVQLIYELHYTNNPQLKELTIDYA